jgi:hypothetical protein
MADKKISDYGVKLLKELEHDRKSFRNKDMDREDAKTIAIMANSTSRVMRETLNSRKFEFAKKTLSV